MIYFCQTGYGRAFYIRSAFMAEGFETTLRDEKLKTGEGGFPAYVNELKEHFEKAHKEDHDCKIRAKNDSTNEEISLMIDALSTNLTSFFREEKHFNFLKNSLIPEWSADKDDNIRIWSAGCSSGEEPYTIAIIIQEASNILNIENIKILATDISTKMTMRAKKGSYEEERLKKIPLPVLRKYFLRGTEKLSTYYSLKPIVRNMVTIGKLNLLDKWPMKGKFNLIFCRNVMIYFDKSTQERLINRYENLLKPNGFLFVGHSESLTGVKHNLKYVQPTIYQKND